MNLDELAQKVMEPAVPENKTINDILNHLLIVQKQNVEIISKSKKIETKSEEIQNNAEKIVRNIAILEDDNKTLAAKLDALSQLKTLKNNKLDTLHLMLLGVAAFQTLVILFLIFKL